MSYQNGKRVTFEMINWICIVLYLFDRIESRIHVCLKMKYYSIGLKTTVFFSLNIDKVFKQCE